jgi:5-hydroxyisourate hydrolase-like protein (transthyretin family)
MLVCLLLIACGWSATPAAAETVLDYQTLPFGTYGGSAIDAERARLYVSAGAGDDRIAVVPLNGGTVQVIDGLPGAEGLAIAPDGTLWVALPDVSEIAAVDHQTFDVRRIDTPGIRPELVGPGHERVLVTNDDAPSMLLIDIATGEQRSAAVSGVAYPHRIPGSNRLLLTGDRLSVYDPDRDEVLSSRPLLTGEASVSPAGDRALIEHDVEVEVVSLPDLGTLVRSQAVYGLPGAISPGYFAHDGGNPDILVRDDSTGAAVNSIDFGPSSGYAVAVFAHGEAMAILTRAGGPELRLYVADRPARPEPVLTAAAVGTSLLGRPAVVRGTLRDGAEPVAGATIELWDLDQDRLVSSATTESNGSWEASFTTDREDTSLEVRAQPLDEHKATSVTVRVVASLPATSVSVTGPTSVAPGETAVFNGSVATDTGEPRVDTLVETVVRCVDTGTEIARVATWTNDQGDFTQRHDPGRCVQLGYTFRTFRVDGVSESAETHLPLTVTWQRPVITVVAPAVVVPGTDLEAVATLTIDGHPAPGRLLSFEARDPWDGGRSLGTALTDVNGRAVLTDVARTGDWRYTARYDGDELALPTAGGSWVTVRQQVASIELAPLYTEVTSGDSVSFTGTMTLPDGSPVAGASITVFRVDPGDVSTVAAQPTTAADGSFAFTAVPPPGDTEYRAFYPPSDVLAAELGRARVRAVRVPVKMVTESTGESIGFGQTFTFSGRIERADGSSTEGLQVAVVRTGAQPPATTLPTVSTDVEGRFTVSDVPPTVGDFSYRVRVAPTVRYEGAEQLVRVEVTRLASELTLDSTPAEVHLDTPVTVSGILLDSDGGAVADTGLSVTRVHPEAASDLGTVLTDADGRFTLIDSPPSVGVHEYVVRLQESWQFEGAVASMKIRVTRFPTLLTLTPPPDWVDRGVPVTVSGQVSRPEGEELPAGVLVTRDSSSGTSWIGMAPVAPNGSFSLADIPPAAGRFTYRASVGQTPRHGAASATVTTWVRRELGLTSEVRGRLISHDPPTLRLGRAGRLVTRATAPEPGLCVRYAVERLGRDGWWSVSTSACRATDAQGTARLRIDSSRTGRYRAVATFAGNPTWAPVAARWARWRITR